MALPNTEISVPDVRDELGAATNDVGRLCIHPNINKWSKWKPVRHGSINPLTEAQLRSTNYGLGGQELSNIVAYNKQSGASGVVMDNPLIWGYSKPIGTAISPYRLSDFRLYNKLAIPAISDVEDIVITQKMIDNYFLGYDTTWHPSFKFGPQSFEQVGTSKANMEIHLYMLEIIAGKNIQNGEWRMGIAIWHPTEKVYYIASSPSFISDTLDASTVNAIFVSLFNQSTNVRNLFMDMEVGDTLQAIPFLGYQLLKNNTLNEFYFSTPNGKAFNFPQAETISITRRAYELDLSTDMLLVQTVGASGYTQGVFPNATTVIQGILNKLAGTGEQGIKVKFTVTKPTSMMAGSQGSYIVFKDGAGASGATVNIPISSINGSTARQTLAVGVEHEIVGGSSLLRSILNSKTNPTGPDQYLSAGIKIIDEYIEIGSVNIRYRVS